MSRHDPALSLRQMRDHANELQTLMQGRSRSDLDADRVLALAVVRLLDEGMASGAAKIPVAPPVPPPVVAPVPPAPSVGALDHAS
jgi:hypothetical protein